jgi:hypothetical protein
VAGVLIASQEFRHLSEGGIPVLSLLTGYRTYLAAAGLLGLAVFQVSQSQFEPAWQSLMAALAAFGLRQAMNSNTTSNSRPYGLLLVALLLTSPVALAQGDANILERNTASEDKRVATWVDVGDRLVLTSFGSWSKQTNCELEAAITNPPPSIHKLDLAGVRAEGEAASVVEPAPASPGLAAQVVHRLQESEIVERVQEVPPGHWGLLGLLAVGAWKVGRGGLRLTGKVLLGGWRVAKWVVTKTPPSAVVAAISEGLSRGPHLEWCRNDSLENQPANERLRELVVGRKVQVCPKTGQAWHGSPGQHKWEEIPLDNREQKLLRREARLIAKACRLEKAKHEAEERQARRDLVAEDLRVPVSGILTTADGKRCELTLGRAAKRKA